MVSATTAGDDADKGVLAGTTTVDTAVGTEAGPNPMTMEVRRDDVSGEAAADTATGNTACGDFGTIETYSTGRSGAGACAGVRNGKL
jgi:hypothetical protein